MTFTTAKKKNAVRMAQVWEQEVLTKGSSDYTVYGIISAVWETVIKNKSPIIPLMVTTHAESEL